MAVKSSLVSLFLAATLSSQSAPVPKPSFDVASVRRDDRPAASVYPFRGGPGSNDPGRLTFTKVPLLFVIRMAFDIDFDRIEGPDWLKGLHGDLYTIAATMPPETTKEQFRLMLQNLLAERFGLKVHQEVRSLRGFELMTAPGGPKLAVWTPEPVPDGPIPRYSEDSQGFPVLAQGHTACQYGGIARVVTALKVTCRQSMADFVENLGRFIQMANGSLPGEQRPQVIDKTGLPGIYEFRFVFEGAIVFPFSTSPDLGTGDSGPSLGKALENLGLKLVKSGNVPVTFLVVDHVERVPTEN